MRALLYAPGLLLMLGSCIYFILLCYSWLSLKLGFIWIFVGVVLAPVTILVAPIWKGVSTGNWWMLLLLPLAWVGSLIGSASGVFPHRSRRGMK
jgi:hypothetical protein